MHEVVGEPIEVLVSCAKGKLLPLFFKWRERRYRVGQINLIHSQADGSGRLYYFNISDRVNYFKLSFSTRTLHWQLEELYTEG